MSTNEVLAAPPGDRSTAQARLAVLFDRLNGRTGTIALGEVVDAFGSTAIGLMLLLLTVPTLLPIPGPVGMVFGSVLAVIAAQLMIGVRRLWLPSALRRRHLPVSVVRSIISHGEAILRRGQWLLKPRRLLPLTGRIGRVALAIPLLLMAVAIAMPIPLGNFLPALSLIALALGITVRDGVAVLAGLILAMVATVWLSVLVMFGTEIVSRAASLFAR